MPSEQSRNPRLDQVLEKKNDIWKYLLETRLSLHMRRVMFVIYLASPVGLFIHPHARGEPFCVPLTEVACGCMYLGLFLLFFNFLFSLLFSFNIYLFILRGRKREREHD